jgi:hypothetical protein
MAPIRFLQMVVDGLGSGGKDAGHDDRLGAFLLTRIGRLLYSVVLLVTATILTGGANACFEASFPADLREWRAEAKERRLDLRSQTTLATARLDSLRTLTRDAAALARARMDLQSTIDRLRIATQQGFDLRQRAGFWDALIEDFYQQAWRSLTDGRDNVFTSPERRESHRLAIEAWDQRIQTMLDQSSINEDRSSEARTQRPLITAYGLGRIIQMDSLVSATSALENITNLERAVQSAQAEVVQLEQQADAISQALSEQHILSEVDAGLWVILLTLVSALLWIWVAGVATESLMLVVGINRDIGAIRTRLDTAVSSKDPREQPSPPE